MVLGLGVTGSPKLMSSLSLILAVARVQSIDRRTPRYRSLSRMVVAVVVDGSKPMPSASSTRATSLTYPMMVS